MNVNKDKARQDYWDQQSQDTEGGVADSVSYIIGHLTAQAYLIEVMEKLERELYQQRFNNKHNLSIDQKISDEIERLRNVNKELESDNEELRYLLKTLTQEL